MKTICNTQKNNAQQHKFSNLVEKIYNESKQPIKNSGTQEDLLREFFNRSKEKSQERETFKRLLLHLNSEKCKSLLRERKYLKVIHNMSSFGTKFVRNVEDWKRVQSASEKQLSSFLKFCFTKYETPKFLEKSFLMDQKQHMFWYIELGAGKSVTELSGFPVKFTKKMAHEFRNAPNYLSVIQAIRYAQALGFGASEKTAMVISLSGLAVITEATETLTSSLMKFFAKEENLVTQEIELIFTYATEKFQENNSFSLKGRTFNSLLKRATEWKNAQIGPIISWESIGITPLYVEEFENDKKVIYKTVELCNSAELYEEGLAMQHCVASYDEDCAHGYTSIFSLQKQIEDDTPKRLATIEVVLPEKFIGEVSAKYNEASCKKADELIEKWIETSEINTPKVVSNSNVAQIAHQERIRDNEGLFLLCKIVFWLLYFVLRMAFS